MIYERLPTKTTHHRCQKQWICPMFKTVTNFAYTLVETAAPSLSILYTCRQIHAEASAIMKKKANDVLSTPPRIIVSTRDAQHLKTGVGPIFSLLNFLPAVQQNPAAKYRDFWEELMHTFSLFGQDQTYPSCKFDTQLDRWIRTAIKHFAYIATEGKAPTVEIALQADAGRSADNLAKDLGQFAVAHRDHPTAVTICARLVRNTFSVFSSEEARLLEEALKQRTDSRIDKGAVGSNVVMGSDIEAIEWQDDWMEGERHSGRTC